MGMGGGGPHSRRRNGTSADRAERPKVRADRSERGQERGERDKSRTRHTRSQASSNSAGSSESGESSKGSSSRTTNSVEMVDGFALFVLAIQDNLRAKLKKAKSGGHVSDQSLFSELRRLWEEMGEEQQLEWQSQANNMPSSLSGSHDGSSLNEDEDSSSQDSSVPSAADRSGSASSFPFRKSTKPTAPAGSTLSIARAAAERLEPEAAATQVGANLNKNESAEVTPASAAMPNFLKQQEPGWQHFPSTAVQSPAVRSSIADSSQQQQQQQNSFASGVSLAQAAREAALSSMSMEERMNIADAAGRANVPLSLLGSIHGLGGVGAAGLDHVLQLQRQQQHVADMHSLYGLRAPTAAQYVMMSSSLQGLQNAGLQTAGSLLPVHLQTLHEAHSCHLPSMILPSTTLTSQNSRPQQPSSLHASTLQQIVGARDPCVLGSNQVAGGQLPSAHAHGLMYMPIGVSDGHGSHLSTLQDAAHTLSVQHAAQQRAAPALGSTGGSQSSTQAWLHAGGMHYSAFAMQSQQHMAAHLQQQHLGAAGKRSLFETPERSGVRPTPEPPQVRTMTFVCDLFSPHEGQISLPVLADSCNIVTSGFGIVGLSCQLSSAEGTRVVKRGQVKDARRHFAHQAQLRLSLARSPNLSVKVFSTGRLQIAGCHDETSCMEAVKIVAQALNEIFRKDPLIMKRQVKSGEHVGAAVEGEIDLGKLPSPKIVMINCSFDSVRARVAACSTPLAAPCLPPSDSGAFAPCRQISSLCADARP